MVQKSHLEYWEKEWRRREIPGGQLSNSGKARKIVDYLWTRPDFIRLNKLEIGCGLCMHINTLSFNCREWGENYTGVDESEYAVKVAHKRGMNAICTNFLDYNTDQRYSLFLFMDVLEHIQDHKAVAEKLKAIAGDEYHVFGNCPLYFTEHDNGCFERPFDISVLLAFFKMAGITSYWHEIYGIRGYPYMMFAGTNK